jgi:hypothetical protein
MTPCHTAMATPTASQTPPHTMATTQQASIVHRRRRHYAHATRMAHANPPPTGTKDAVRVTPLQPRAPATATIPNSGTLTARTIQQQVAAAAAVAERMSASDVKQNSEPKRSETASADTAATVPANKVDGLVVVVMARPDVKSIAELTGKTIAIDSKYSASNGSVRSAIAAAGALEVQLSQGQTMAIDRLASGETPAAVLALVSASAAESFPDIAGYKTFHVPLSPHALSK